MTGKWSTQWAKSVGRHHFTIIKWTLTMDLPWRQHQHHKSSERKWWYVCQRWLWLSADVYKYSLYNDKQLDAQWSASINNCYTNKYTKHLIYNSKTHKNTGRDSESRGSFIPAEWDKIWGSGHFLGTRAVKQHHLCNIPHILSKHTCV